MAPDEIGRDRHEPMHQPDEIVSAAATAVAVTLEQLDGVVDDVFDVGGMAHRERGEFFDVYRREVN